MSHWFKSMFCIYQCGYEFMMRSCLLISPQMCQLICCFLQTYCDIWFATVLYLNCNYFDLKYKIQVFYLEYSLSHFVHLVILSAFKSAVSVWALFWKWIGNPMIRMVGIASPPGMHKSHWIKEYFLSYRVLTYFVDFSLDFPMLIKG